MKGMKVFIEDLLFYRYGIINGTEGTGYWMIPDVSANTNEELGEIWDMIACTEFENLEINNGDTVAVYRAGNNVIELCNVDNNTYGYVNIGSFNGLYDDDRYALINEIADMFKEYDNVNFDFYLLYTEEQMIKYVRACEGMICDDISSRDDEENTRPKGFTKANKVIQLPFK